MRLLLVFLLYGAGTTAALFSVTFAAALFLWNDIFLPLSFARSTGNYPVAQYVMVVLAASYLLAWVRGKVKIRFGVYFYAVSAFLLWIFVTVLTSPYQQVAWDQFILYLKYMGPLILIHICIESRKDVVILGAVLTASVGVWAAQAGIHCLIHGPNTGLGIPHGQMSERNDFSAAIVGTLPMMLYFAFSYAWRFKRTVRAGVGLAFVLSLCAIFFSLSRGASVGLAVSIFIYIVFISKKKLRDTALLVVVAGLGLLLVPESWYARMSTIEIGVEQTEGSAQSRMVSMLGALEATKDYPVFGLGPGGWLEVAELYAIGLNPHSIYLVLSSEHGIPGLVLYLSLMVMVYMRSTRLIRKASLHRDPEMVRLAAALTMGIFGLLAAMSFLNRPFNEYLWAWIAITSALPAVYQRELDEKARSEFRKRILAQAD